MSELDLAEKWKEEARSWREQAEGAAALAEKAVTAVERMRWWRTACIPLVGFLATFVPIQLVGGCEKSERIETLAADANTCHDELEKMKQESPTITPAPECPACPGCPPPPPGCTESGQLAQCSGRLDEYTHRLDECTRELNWREQKVDFGEWFAKMQEQADKKITDLRAQYFTLLEQVQPLVDRAKEMGLGPRVRDWLNKPGAIDLYLELGSRWAEIDLIYAQMRGVIQEADSIAQRTCYQNIVWSWGEILPDERDHDRLQQAVYRLTDGDYLMYFYELRRRARNEEERP